MAGAHCSGRWRETSKSGALWKILARFGQCALWHEVANSRGQYLGLSDARRSEVLLFASDGKFLRTIGREGQGPGEFTWAAGLADVAPRLRGRPARVRLLRAEERTDHRDLGTGAGR